MNNRAYCRRLFASRDDDVLLDLIEMAILDYLSYNVDSKYYQVIRRTGTNLTVHLDHGRRFV